MHKRHQFRCKPAPLVHHIAVEMVMMMMMMTIMMVMLVMLVMLVMATRASHCSADDDVYIS